MSQGMTNTYPSSLFILLLDGLYRYKPHIGSAHRLADRFSIIGIIFIALDVGFYKLGSNEFDGITVLLKLACPMVGATACLHSNNATRLNRLQ